MNRVEADDDVRKIFEPERLNLCKAGFTVNMDWKTISLMISLTGLAMHLQMPVKNQV